MFDICNQCDLGAHQMIQGAQVAYQLKAFDKCGPKSSYQPKPHPRSWSGCSALIYAREYPRTCFFQVAATEWLV